jgi:hypothetical protein
MDCFGPSAATAVRTERKKAGRNFMAEGVGNDWTEAN